MGSKFMIKLTEREIQMCVVALHWYAKWNDSNPDVGMGDSVASLLEELLPDMVILNKEEKVEKLLSRETDSQYDIEFLDFKEILAKEKLL